MFEYWFHGLDDGDGKFIHHGHTHDFLEVCAQIAQCFDNEIAGKFVAELLNSHEKELAFLRVIEWKFNYEWANVNEPDSLKKIVLHKLR